MPHRRRVTFASSAVADMENVLHGYRERGAQQVGDCLMREVIRSPSRIVYRLDAERVRVVRLWRGERLIRLP